MSETTELVTTQGQSPAVRPEVRVVHDNSKVGNLMDTARFEQAYRIARALASATLIPDHLKKGGPNEAAANCFLVVNQALRWELDPFAVAPCTYSIGGKLAFEGKLIAAIVNDRAGLRGRLSYSFEGKGDDLTVTVSGTFRDEPEPRTVTLSVRQAKTNNGMWTKDPEQKLCYSGAIRWARRWCPEVVLGVVIKEEMEETEKPAIAREVSTLKFEEGAE